MTETRDVIALTVAGALAFLLQIAIAPSIKIMGIMPNFVTVYLFLVAVTRYQTFGCVLPFVLGLAFDFLSGGPVGALALCAMVFTVAAARLFAAIDNDTLFMPLIVMGVGLLLTEVLYAIILLAVGYNAGALQAIFFRAVPCAVYDCVIAFILFPLAHRFFTTAGPSQPIVTTQLR